MNFDGFDALKKMLIGENLLEFLKMLIYFFLNFFYWIKRKGTELCLTSVMLCVSC